MKVWLIIIVLLMSGSFRGGADVEIERIQFRSMVACERAQQEIAQQGELMDDRGVYKILAYCHKDQPIN